MKKLITHPALISVVVVLAAAVVGWYSYTALSTRPKVSLVQASQENVTEEVQGTGAVNAAEDVNLGFEVSGPVVAVNVAVGDKVYAGEALASLSTASAEANLAGAQAALQSAQAQANIQGTNLEGANTTLSEAQSALVDQIQSDYTAADDAVRTQASQFFNNPRTQNDMLVLVIPDSQLTSTLQAERYKLEQDLTAWKNALPESGSTNNLDAAASNARAILDEVNTFLANAAQALNEAIVTSDTPASSIAGWKISISTARGNITAATLGLSGAEAKLTAAESASQVAAQQAASENATGTVSVSGAAIAAAEANVQELEVALSKTVLRAPFAGTITSMDAKLGQIVSPGVPVASMISDANYEIDLYVSEIDVAKIRVGQNANVTLDAYGNSVIFPARVASVDPAETMQNGVAAYKVTLVFVNADSRIKSGMNANVDIIGATSANAVVVPESALIIQGSGEYVLLSSPEGATPVLHKVTTGITGADGMVEITSGLSVGDWIAGTTN